MRAVSFLAGVPEVLYLACSCLQQVLCAGMFFVMAVWGMVIVFLAVFTDKTDICIVMVMGKNRVGKH